MTHPPASLPLRGGQPMLSDGAQREGTDWRDDALCTQVDLDVWFPAKGGSIAAAKRICALCPVRAECLAEALRIGADGVWGGTGPQERRRLGGSLYASAAPYLPLSECGTDAAAQRHRRAGERCPVCRVGGAT